MNPQQAPQPRSQGLTDDQQAQWQQQFQQQQHQQPMPGLQHPQPQHYAPVPDLSTPQLDTMYPQGAQGHEQLYGQQDPAQNPQQFFGHQQMPQTPQAFAWTQPDNITNNNPRHQMLRVSRMEANKAYQTYNPRSTQPLKRGNRQT
jgi:hypothetical protein